MKDTKNRLLFNKAIVDKLYALVKQYPEQRFGQLLINCGVLECTMEGDTAFVRDCFNEEPEVTWQRMCKNEMCFKQDDQSEK